MGAVAQQSTLAEGPSEASDAALAETARAPQVETSSSHKGPRPNAYQHHRRPALQLTRRWQQALRRAAAAYAAGDKSAARRVAQEAAELRRAAAAAHREASEMIFREHNAGRPDGLVSKEGGEGVSGPLAFVHVACVGWWGCGTREAMGWWAEGGHGRTVEGDNFLRQLLRGAWNLGVGFNDVNGAGGQVFCGGHLSPLRIHLTVNTRHRQHKHAPSLPFYQSSFGPSGMDACQRTAPNSLTTNPRHASPPQNVLTSQTRGRCSEPSSIGRNPRSPNPSQRHKAPPHTRLPTAKCLTGQTTEQRFPQPLCRLHSMHPSPPLV